MFSQKYFKKYFIYSQKPLNETKASVFTLDWFQKSFFIHRADGDKYFLLNRLFVYTILL